MFKEERISLLNLENEVSLKLINNNNEVVALLFIKNDKIIIRGDLVVEKTTIKCPVIDIL
jgi:hypothetical protein